MNHRVAGANSADPLIHQAHLLGDFVGTGVWQLGGLERSYEKRVDIPAISFHQDARHSGQSIAANTHELPAIGSIARKNQYDVHRVNVPLPALIAYQSLQRVDPVAERSGRFEIQAVRFMIAPPTEIV
jgi:hypothetical protein